MYDVLAGGYLIFFLSGGAARTTVRLHIKYETKQVPEPGPGRRSLSGAQKVNSGAVRIGRRTLYGRSRVLWRNVVRPTPKRWRCTSIVLGRRGSRVAVDRAASRVRNRTRHRRRVWLVAAASKPVHCPPVYRSFVCMVRGGDGPFAGWRNDVRHKARNQRTDESDRFSYGAI